MSKVNRITDPIGYRCEGCGRLCKNPIEDLSEILAAGGLSCCPERKMVGLSDRIDELEAKVEKLSVLVENAFYEGVRNGPILRDWAWENSYAYDDLKEILGEKE